MALNWIRLGSAGGVALALMLSTTHSAIAVEAAPTLGEPGLRDARVPASVPNISGVWQVRGFERQTSGRSTAPIHPGYPGTRKSFRSAPARKRQEPRSTTPRPPAAPAARCGSSLRPTPSRPCKHLKKRCSCTKCSTSSASCT